MSGFAEGSSHATRGQLDQPYINDGDPGPHGGGTYTGHGLEPTVNDYENVFGPAARDIKFDSQRSKRHQRWHLPDALKGPNPFLTDRVDGLITDATNSPFTTVILPYQYVANPDAKLKWNVWSFDEGMASRVPYESAARVLTQTKKSFAGYVVRQGLAITMEHNFMKSPAGMENFRNQLKQLVGSIQYTNDLDVHMALIQAPSYARTVAEKYFNNQKTPLQLCREYIDLFGIIQKTPNALDILIEEAKGTLKNWGSSDPSFLLTNGKLTMQLQMSPERTSYVTQGYDGLKRLRTGPDIESYRGLNIIKSRAFSTEAGLAPRDPLCRRVRVAEYYRIIPDDNIEAWLLYDQSKDTWFEVTLNDLEKDSDPVYQEDIARGQGAVFRFNSHLDGAGGSGLGLDDDHGGILASSAQNDISLDRWSRLPFQEKITRIAGLSNVAIECNGSRVVIRTVSDKQQDVDMLLSIMDQNLNGNGDSSKFQNLLNWSSAWFGGGIFCDTTSHLIPGDISTAETPIANWTAIAMHTPTINAYANITAGSDEAVFKCFQPNNFVFSWEGAHNPENLVIQGNLTLDTVMGAAFALPHMTEDVAKLLCRPIEGVLGNTVTQFHAFLEPCAIQIGTAYSSEHNAPWSSFAMVYFMSRLHPDAEVRAHARRLLQDNMHGGHGTHSLQSFEDQLHAYVSDFFQRPSWTAADAGNELSNKLRQHFAHAPHGAAAAMHHHGASGINSPPLFAKLDLHAHSSTAATSVDTYQQYVTDEGLKSSLVLDVFAIIMAKRLFCGVQRFHRGGLQEDGTPQKYGLSILSREFARLRSKPPQSSAANVNGDAAGATLGEKYPHTPTEIQNLRPGQYSYEYVIIRPNIEHEMLGVIMGRGGSGELGATLWGQTELSCYDDSQHGVWGMSYKYHERAQVFNEKNMIRLWDIAFNGYNGGMDDSVMQWTKEDITDFKKASNDMSRPYTGKSMMVMRFPMSGPKWKRNWPSPIVFYDDGGNENVTADPECIHKVVEDNMRVFTNNPDYRTNYNVYKSQMPNFDAAQRLRKPAGTAAAQDETSSLSKLAFQGSMKARLKNGTIIDIQTGCGHLGPSYVGVASVREGKGYKQQGAPTLGRMV